MTKLQIQNHVVLFGYFVVVYLFAQMSSFIFFQVYFSNISYIAIAVLQTCFKILKTDVVKSAKDDADN